MPGYWESKLKELEEEEKRRKKKAVTEQKKETMSATDKAIQSGMTFGDALAYIASRNVQKSNAFSAPEKSTVADADVAYETQRRASKNIPSLDQEKKFIDLLNAGGVSIEDVMKYGEIPEEFYKVAKQHGVDDYTMKYYTLVAREASKPKYFDSGAFKDGWQFGDLTKTILGTSNDISENVNAAVVDATENLIDVTAAGVGMVGGWFGKKDFQDRTDKFIAKDFLKHQETGEKISRFTNWTNPIGVASNLIVGKDTEEASVLGDKSDSLVQSGAHMVGSMALQKVGVPWWLTQGVNSYGSELESALAQGATRKEAHTSAGITTAAEIGSELLFKGSGFGEKGIIPTGWITKGLKKGGGKVAADLAVDLASEAAEEVVSQAASNAGQVYRDEDLKSRLWSEQAREEYRDAAIGGAAISFGTNVGRAVKSVKKGRDYNTGLTEDEQLVLDKAFEKYVAEAEADGKELTKKQKEKEYEAFSEMLKKGYITTDTIEEVLGGDTYNEFKTAKDEFFASDIFKGYKKSVAEQEKLQKEYEELGKKQNPTLAEQSRFKKLEEILSDTSKTDSAKEQLDSEAKRINEIKLRLMSEVSEKVKGSYLAESYNELARKREKYSVDTSKYEGNAKKTIQNILDSGYGDNTNQFHEFADWLANISNDKALTFDVTRDADLKGTEHSYDGKRTNAYITSDGTVTLNLDSSKALNVVAGHEIVHALEKSGVYQDLQNAVFNYEITRKGQKAFDERLQAVKDLYKGIEGTTAETELTADLIAENLFSDYGFVQNLAVNHRNIFQKVYDEVKYLLNIATAGSKEARELEKVKRLFDKAYSEKSVNQKATIQNEVKNSLSEDTSLSDKAIAKNDELGFVDSDIMTYAKSVRERIASRLRSMKDNGVAIPDDIKGNTAFANSSYDISEENTTICPRSLAAEAFVDAVSEYLGRPLSVEEQIYISQDLQGRSLTPECTYCYVATDRKAYRAFLGEYVNQRDAVIDKLKADPNADVSRSGSLYNEFLNGRKDTNQMYNRFKMWVDAYKNGTPMVQASHLANINKLMGDINSEFGEVLKPQIVDAMKYAQSASWAKKRVSYVAYDGHILKWKQNRIDKLNSHYGLRMYSFSDFHPAFVLENMQMLTDAAARGLKVLGYTKDTDFVEIFAPTGMNINISTFGFESGGNVYENNIIGANWDKAKALREQNPNVGITFVATNDTLVEWALAQDWIDVVIPYHLVRTGEAVAQAFNYTNYTSESSDTKTKDWTKEDKKYISPAEHNNDKQTYLDALEKNHLQPRFKRFLDNPNYMKLVNECRLPASESQPVQPTFNEDAANSALSKLEANGYYQPVGGSVERMYEIAAEVAEDMTQKIGKSSLSDIGEVQKTTGNYQYYGSDIGAPKDPFAEFAPTREDIATANNVATEATTSPTFDAPVANKITDAPMAKTIAEDESVGAAPYGFNPVTSLQYEYGTIPEGENPVRDDSLPKSTTGDDKVSYTARTVKGAKVTPDEFVDLLDKQTVGGRLSYMPITNNETVKKAMDNIARKGWEAAKAEWQTKVRRGEVSAELSATGSLLLNNAAKAGDIETWLDILHDYQLMGTNAGQAVQAMRILKTLNPDDSLYMIDRSIEQMVEDMNLKTDIVIDESLRKAYTEAKTPSEKNDAIDAIMEDVARQIPPTIKDKWTALRYLNMLGNFKTQIRNVLGNFGMSLVSRIKNSVAAGMEFVANKVSGGKFQRTKSLMPSRKMVKAAKKYFADVEYLALNGGKYNDTMEASGKFAQGVQDSRRIFWFAPLEWYRRATNWAMDKGDLLFSRSAFARSLAGYLKANGIKETDFSKIDPQTLDKATAYAIKEAQEQTFRDNNTLSSWVSKIGRRKDTPKAMKFISEGTIPFRKTPANILVRAEEYSPMGIINSTVKTLQAAFGSKEITGADVVNSWAKTFTGTGLFYLGMLLSNSGILKGGPDEDEEREQFENQYGWQNYSIQIGDYNYTIDFFTPASMPLLMGAQFNELRQDGGIELKDLETALLSIADPMIEMSMLQGVNDTLDNVKYSDNSLGQLAINAGVSYLTQGLTNSFVGQLERSFEGQRMTTYVDKDSGTPEWLQKTLGKASAKTPVWDYQQIPYINAWGETEDYDTVSALAENTLSPSYISKGVSDDVYEELNRLNDAQSDINVYPQTPSKTVTFDDANGVRHEDYNLSAGEYVELAKLQGQTQKKLVEDILSNKMYGELTDNEKAKAVQLAYQYAREYGRQEVLDADGFSSKWMEDAGDNIVDAIIAHTSEERTFAYNYPEKYKVAQSIGGYDAYKKYTADVKDMKLGEKAAYISKMKLTDKQKNALINAETDRKEPIDMTGYNTSKYSSFEEFEYSKEYPGKYAISKSVGGYDSYKSYSSELSEIKADKDENGKTISGSRKKKVVEYINGLDAEYEEKLILYKSEYPSDDRYNQEIVDYVLDKDDLSYEEKKTILEELGFKIDSKGRITG